MFSYNNDEDGTAMPGFDTPEPISVTLELGIGSVRITASGRTDTTVEVLPCDNADGADVWAAEQTKVTCSDGTLLVRGPRKHSLPGGRGSLEVNIGLPAGSGIRGTSPLADFTCAGRLGNCRLRTSVGDIRVEEAETVFLRTGRGDIRLDRVAGDAEVVGAGRIEIGVLAGTATIKNLNGETTIGEVTGDLRANSANGRIFVGVAHAGVDAKCAGGGIRIGEVVRDRVVLQSAAGDIEVGIRESTTAWLDVHTRLGSVRTSLGPSEGPPESLSEGSPEGPFEGPFEGQESSGETVEVRARTGAGDIVIHRS